MLFPVVVAAVPSPPAVPEAPPHTPSRVVRGLTAAVLTSVRGRVSDGDATRLCVCSSAASSWFSSAFPRRLRMWSVFSGSY